MNIAVLISGGVDSAVVAHRLKEEGHDLHLFYIRIGLDDGSGDCSAEEDIEMCRLIARQYGLPFDVVSLHQEYWDNVMEYALRTVREGLTPNPDIMCNKMIKFGFFEERWGHGIRPDRHRPLCLDRSNRRHQISCNGSRPGKDQTDFLARISYSQLSHLMFPLGTMPKAKVRETAIEARLPNAFRKDSQGICFLGKINYNDFIKRHLGIRKGGYHRAGDRPQTGRAQRILVSHNRPAQRARPERRPMVCGKEECTRQCSVCVARLFHRKAIWPHASSRRDALHIGQSVGRCIVARKDYIQEPSYAGISVGHAHPP